MMATTIYLLPHQERFIQSPECFPEIRWHFLLGGYGAGKTISLVQATLYYISRLQGVRDDAGKYARLMVGGYTYAHLEQTYMIDLMSYLDQSKTVYRNDTKNHIMYIGTVQIIFAQLSEPDRIFGQSTYCFVDSTKVLTKDKNANILELSIKDMREGYEVLTRKGWKKVLKVHDNGYKECMRVGNTLCTPDHRFAVGDSWVEAQNLTSDTPLWKCSVKDAKLCQELEDGVKKLLQILKNLMESSITDTQTLSQIVSESIIGVKTIKRIMLRCGKNTMDLFLKDTVFITLTAIHLIMNLVIYSAYLIQSTTNCMVKSTDKQDFIKLLSTVQQCLKQLKHAWKMLSRLECADSAEKSIKEYTLQDTALNHVVKQLKRSHRSDTPSSVKTVPWYFKHPSIVLDSAARSAEMLGHISKESLLTKCVKQGYASSVARHLSAADRLRHRLAHLTAKTSREGELYHVYDLTVDDCHEFFADGMLAHNCALLDEIDELPEDTMIEAMKSVSQRCRQKLKDQRSCHIMSASTAQGYKGFYRLYTQYKKNGVAFVLIRALTRDNIYLPKEYIEDLEKSFTETERKVYMEGEFLSVSQGRVIPGFDWDRNFISDDMDIRLPPHCKIFIGQDFNSGYHRASAWVSDAQTGTMHCIKYYDFPDVMEAPNVFRYDFPTQDLYWIPDVTSKDSFPQFARALRQNNVHIIYRKKSPMVEDSCFLISSLCYQGRIMCHNNAVQIAEAFAQASRDKNNKIPKGVGESSPIHAIDGARYATSYMALVLPEYRDVRRSIMTHLPTYRNIIETGDEEEKDVKDLTHGYTQIEGNAYL